jgi:hypothetical protein
MRIDWYDRGILSFVLESELLSGPQRDATTPVKFGIDAARITKRFNAVVDLYDSRLLDSLEEPDLELMRRATRYRDHVVATCN